LCIWEKYIIFTFWVWLISLNMVNSCLFFFICWGLNSRPYLEPLHQPFFVVSHRQQVHSSILHDW
jgi:hypothetical protein